MRNAGTLALLLLTSAFAGCIGALDDQTVETVEPTSADALSSVEDLLSIGEDGVPQLHVPVDVVLLGFEEGTASALDVRLEPERVEHVASSFHRVFPPEASDPKTPLSSSPIGVPMAQVAHYRIHEAPEALEERFFETVRNATVGDDPRVYDGNRVEAFLADALPRHGLNVSADRPPLVLVHGNDELPSGHGYRYTYPSGHLEPVRVFGEHKPLLVADLSAREDPYDHSDPGPLGGVLLPDDAPDDYDRPIPAGGDEAVAAMANATVAATHYRLLQGSIYPITTKPCHAITLVLAVRAQGATHALPTHRAPRELVDTDRLERAFENLTGRDNVYVDLDVRLLPHEDPFLDAASRGSLATNDAVRWWIDENWQDYWIPHEGCEPYVSFLVLGDAADPISFGVGGYDTEKSHRIAFSVVDGRNLLTEDYQGPREETVHQRGNSRYAYDWVNEFYAHETGHTVGQRHPHDVSTTNGGGADRSFSSVWSTMSYQTDDRVVDFGAVDRANHQRNRAGWLVQAAVEEGLRDTPAFQQAVEHLEAYRWMEAGQTLENALATSASAPGAPGR